MKVSVLVPVFGVEKYIEQCACSLFNQTYNDIEFVFVDDCTPDHSIEILKQLLEEYPERRHQVKIVRHSSNKGLGASRKTALAAASGEFVLNVDSDDYLMADAVEILVKAQQETEADIVTGAFSFLSPNGDLTEKHIPPLSRDLTLKLLLVQNTIPYHIWARLIRKRVYTDNGIDSIEGVNMAEDFGLTPRLICGARKIAYIDNIVYVYRLSSSSSTFHHFTSHHHVISFLKAHDAVYQYITTHGENKEFNFALETGMLNTYYQALQAGFIPEQIRNECHYVPRKALFRLCHTMFAHRSTAKLLRLVYLIIKWCYKRKLHFPG